MKYVDYKGEKLHTGSEAYKLWEAKDWKKLDEHLARLDREMKARGEK